MVTDHNGDDNQAVRFWRHVAVSWLAAAAAVALAAGSFAWSVSHELTALENRTITREEFHALEGIVQKNSETLTETHTNQQINSKRLDRLESDRWSPRPPDRTLPP